MVSATIACVALAIAFGSVLVAREAVQLQIARAAPNLHIEVARDPLGEVWQLALTNTGDFPAVDVQVMFFREDILENSQFYHDLSPWIIKNYKQVRGGIMIVPPNQAENYPLHYRLTRTSKSKADLAYFAEGSWEITTNTPATPTSGAGDQDNPIEGLFLYVAYMDEDVGVGRTHHWRVSLNSEGGIEHRTELKADSAELTQLRQALRLDSTSDPS